MKNRRPLRGTGGEFSISAKLFYLPLGAGSEVEEAISSTRP